MSVLGWTFVMVVAIIVVGFLALADSKKIRNFIDHNKIGIKIFAVWLTFTALVVALWPTWLFLFLRAMLSPVGFWQNFILTGLGLYFLESIQLVMLFFFVVFSLMLLLMSYLSKSFYLSPFPFSGNGDIIGLVAQLVRALPCHGRGRGFKSRPVRIKILS